MTLLNSAPIQPVHIIVDSLSLLRHTKDYTLPEVVKALGYASPHGRARALIKHLHLYNCARYNRYTHLLELTPLGLELQVNQGSTEILKALRSPLVFQQLYTQAEHGKIHTESSIIEQLKTQRCKIKRIKRIARAYMNSIDYYNLVKSAET